MIEEKLSKKVTVLFSRTTDQKLNEVCKKMYRSKSNLLRLNPGEFMERIIILKNNPICVLFITIILT